MPKKASPQKTWQAVELSTGRNLSPECMRQLAHAVSLLRVRKIDAHIARHHQIVLILNLHTLRRRRTVSSVPANARLITLLS